MDGVGGILQGTERILSRILTIAWREFSTTVCRVGYILATVGTPVFFLVIAGIAALPSVLAIKEEMAERSALAVVDEAGLLTPEVLAAVTATEPESVGLADEMLTRMVDGTSRLVATRIRPYESREAAGEALRGGQIAAFYIVPPDYVKTGQLEYRTRRSQLPGSAAGSGAPLKPWLLEGLMAGKVDAERRARARRPVADVRVLALRDDGKFAERDEREMLVRFVVPFVFAFILMLSIFIASGYLIQGLVEERSSRIIEVLLARVTPDELIGGKLLGLGGAGLLQLVVWVALAAIPALTLNAITVSTSVVLMAVVYYLLGFLFFGSVMAGVGCIAGTTHESQQLASLWAVVAVVPMLFAPVILAVPNALLARVLSYIPVTCPLTMTMRCASGQVVWWDVPGSLVVLLASTVLAVRLSGRLFRVGLLLQGQRPTIRELLGYLRA